MSLSATDTAAHLQRLALRLPRDGSIDAAEQSALRHAAQIVTFVAEHAGGLRLLVHRLKPETVSAATPATDAALANLPEVRLVLEAFPGSVIESIADLAPIPAPQETA